MAWVGRDLSRSSSPSPLQWAGTSSTRSSCSEPYPTWPGMFPGMRHLPISGQPVPVFHHPHFFLASSPNLPSLSSKPLPLVLSLQALLNDESAKRGKNCCSTSVRFSMKKSAKPIKIHNTSHTGHEKQTAPRACRTTICMLRISTNFLKRSV